MKHTYCMDKLFKFNNRIFLFIKKIKNLQEQEKEKARISGATWKASKFQNLKLRLLQQIMEAIKLYSVFPYFSWDFDTTAWDNLTGSVILEAKRQTFGHLQFSVQTVQTADQTV